MAPEDDTRDPPRGPPGRDALTLGDLALLESLGAGNAWLRAVLCTLARRGVRFRSAHPERARALLDALSVHPLYKGGQFLFDLLEWEDFMVDGPAPPVVPSVLDASALLRLAELLRRIRSTIDGAEVDGVGLLRIEAAVAPADEALPPLEPGLYLYPDVVLGALATVAWSIPTQEPGPDGGAS